MSKEKQLKKKQGSNPKSKNDKENGRPKSSLFNDTDLKSYEMYDTTEGPVPPHTNQAWTNEAIPTGVVDIDESVKLPPISAKSENQEQNSKYPKILRPSGYLNKEKDHLPPIVDQTPRSRHYHHHHNHPYGKYESSSMDQHFEHRSGHQHHHHHHHHKHRHHHDGIHQHHRHHHHRHETEMETYDRRWWYLPPNTVHGPRPWKAPEYHFVPPKWYEPTTRQVRVSFDNREQHFSPRKYVDCRCEVCKPSRQIPRGVKWVVNE